MDEGHIHPYGLMLSMALPYTTYYIYSILVHFYRNDDNLIIAEYRLFLGIMKTRCRFGKFQIQNSG